MKRPLLGLALIGGLLLSACTSRPEEVDLTVLYTTDLHGLVMPIDFETGEPAATSLANVATYAKQVRQENPEGTIMLDAGDWCSGQPSTYYYNYIDHFSLHIVPKAYNLIGYDAVGIGSSDIELGPTLYRERLPQQFQMPIVCANILTDTPEGKPIYKPYTIVERKGIKIAVLGLTRADIDNWVPKRLFRGLHLEKMRSSAKKWLAYIEKNERPDLVIGLFHSGSGIENEEDDANHLGNAAIPTAKQTRGFSLVLFGHDHRSFEGKITDVSGTTFTALEPLPRAQQVGRADLHLTLRRDGKYDAEIKTSLVPMADYEPDPDYCSEFAENTRYVNDYLDHQLGVISDSLYAIDGLFGPSAIVDFIHEMQLWISKADVSLSNFSVSHNVPSGTITMRDLFKIYQYNNQLYTLRMTGDEIDKFLEFGYSRQFNQMRDEHDHLLRFVYDDQGNVRQGVFGAELYTPQYHYTSAAGIKYTVDVSKPEGERVNITECHGEPFLPEKTYIVAMNSHQVAGGGRFVSEGLHWTGSDITQRTITSDVNDLRLSFANYFHLHDTIHIKCRDDWQVLPEAWWQKGKQRDLEALGERFNK